MRLRLSRKTYNLILCLLLLACSISGMFYYKLSNTKHGYSNEGLQFTSVRKSPDPSVTDYEQRLKRTDLFISDFVPTEYTEYVPHQSAFLKQVQKRALVQFEHDESNTIIVNDDDHHDHDDKSKSSTMTSTSTTKTTTTISTTPTPSTTINTTTATTASTPM